MKQAFVNDNHVLFDGRLSRTYTNLVRLSLHAKLYLSCIRVSAGNWNQITVIDSILSVNLKGSLLTSLEIQQILDDKLYRTIQWNSSISCAAY